MLLTKKYDESERKSLISVCLGLETADLVVTGGSIIDVATGEVRRADLAVKGSRIAVVGDIAKTRISSSTRTVDVSGKYVAPGFFDPHAHVESTMLTPSTYSSLVIPHGTAGAVIDPHEVANVSGIEGVKALCEDAKNGPFKFMVQAPSCVPSAPGLETSGHVLGPRDVEELLGYEGVHGLGEVMSYDKVLDRQDEVMEKIRLSYERGTIVDGHSPPLRGERFQAYLSSGVMTDHTARTESEVLERLRSGSQVMIQDRPGESSFESIVDALRKVDTRRAMFCTDDIEPDEVWERGHLDSLVRKAVRLGLDPIKAIQMATLNVAEAYHAESEFGLIAPGRSADLLVLSDLQTLVVEKVILNGCLVASGGNLLIELPKSDFQRFKNTVKLKASLRPDDLAIKADLKEGKAKVRVVTVDGGMVERQLEILNCEVLPDPSQDVARMAVLERHGRKGNIGKGFIHGTGLRRGAIATSISHDAHNLAVIGFTEEDMMAAVNEVERIGGGIVTVTDGAVESRVELPYFGLLNDSLVITEHLKGLRRRAAEMGLRIPLRKLMFLSLPVGRGNFRITDMGVVDYANRTVLSPVVSLSS